nr:hypothetical protein [uncultured Draconibacterium sp.]
MELTRNEKMAILNVLDQIILADGKVDRMEAAFMSAILMKFNMTKYDGFEAREMDLMDVSKTLKDMSSIKKEYFKTLAIEMVNIDGEEHNNEIAIISLIFAFIQ